MAYLRIIKEYTIGYPGESYTLAHQGIGLHHKCYLILSGIDKQVFRAGHSINFFCAPSYGICYLPICLIWTRKQH